MIKNLKIPNDKVFIQDGWLNLVTGILDYLGTEAKAKIKSGKEGKEIKVSFGSTEEDEKSECDNCGRKGIKIYAKCQYTGVMGQKCVPNNFFSKYLWAVTKKLCKDCAKKCKSCGMFFCLKHINNHKCW